MSPLSYLQRDLIEKTFASCPNLADKKQISYLLARHGYSLKLDDEGSVAGEGLDDQSKEQLREILSNSKLSEHFLALARDLDVMEPKQPEDVYKTHLVDGR